MSDELISGLGGAMIGAVLTGLLTWLLHSREQSSAKKQELRGLITMLIDLREDFQSRITKIIDSQARETAGQILSMKRTIYLEAVENLTNDIPRHVTSSEYAIIAEEMADLANFTKARLYFSKSIKASRSAIYKAHALRSMAVFYFRLTPEIDINKGREYFEQAIKTLQASIDPYSIYSLGFIYETWGLNEIGNGFRSEGLKKLVLAREQYEILPTSFALRNLSLEWLDNKLQSITAINEDRAS